MRPERRTIDARRCAAALAAALCAAACAGIEDAPGKRTRGTVIDDQRIARAVSRALRETEGLEHGNIDVTAFNYVVLLTGQVPSPQARALAVKTASGVRKVAGVRDELTVSGAASWLAGANDAWLLAKIRSRLLLSDQIHASRVQVTVEGSVVYLMGLLTRAEADAVVEIVQRTGGIAKIVRLFEYLPDAQGEAGAPSGEPPEPPEPPRRPDSGEAFGAP